MPNCSRTLRAGRWPSLPLLVVLSSVWGILLGCSGDTTGPALLPATQLYMALTLNQHAVNLDTAPPYNTIQLSATALTAAATPLAVGDSTVHYRDQDSSVSISPTGLVTAHYVTSGTQVIASLTVGGVTHTDTAVIRVTQSPFPAPLATLSIQPLPRDLDSAADAIDDQGLSINNGQGNIPVYATDAKGDSVCSDDLPCQLVVHFTSSDPTIATFRDNVKISPMYPGRVKIIVSTLAYGVFKADTLAYVIGYPAGFNAILYVPNGVIGGKVTPPYFYPPKLVVGVGGRSFMQSLLADSVDVAFDDSTAVVGGGTQFFGTGAGIVISTFNQPGSYTYRSRRHGGSGQVVVVSNDSIR